MNNYSFRPSKGLHINKQIFIALAGTTGAGKTESALRIATGIVGDTGKKVCVIDTEHERALNKKDRYDFDHLDLRAPYSPDNFKGVIEAAEEAGYGCIIIDNFSHEWFGEGGCSDMQEEVLEKMSGGDFRKAQGLTAIAWKTPKQKHKKLMYRILQCNVPLIFCLRAEPKIKFQKGTNGKTEIVDAGWQPIVEKMFPYEMLVYALLMPEDSGVPTHLKQLEPELAPMFPAGKQITEKSGELLAEWARGTHGKKADDLPTRRTAMLDHFAKLGVDNERVLSRVGRANIEDIQEPQMGILKGLATDVKSGTQSLIEAFPEVVTDRSEIPVEPEDTDTHDADDAEMSDLERKRADCQTLFNDLDKRTREKLCPPSTALIRDMHEAQLSALITEIEALAK